MLSAQQDMSTGYTLLNGFAIAMGFVFSLVALLLLVTDGSGINLLIISLLVILLGLVGWQYIQTLVRLDEMATELQVIKSQLPPVSE